MKDDAKAHFAILQVFSAGVVHLKKKKKVLDYTFA